MSSDGRKHESQLSGFLLIRTLILLDQDPTLITSYDLNYPPKDALSKYSHFGIGASIHEFGEGMGIQSLINAILESFLKGYLMAKLLQAKKIPNKKTNNDGDDDDGNNNNNNSNKNNINNWVLFS